MFLQFRIPFITRFKVHVSYTSAEEWSVMTGRNEEEIFVAYREVCVECLRKFLNNPHYDIHHSPEIRDQKLMNTQEKY